MPPRTTTRTSAAALGLLLAAFALPARAATPPPDAETLLDWALDQPKAAYRGRMMFTQWFGKQTRAEDVEVYREGDKSRREFLAPDGSVARVIISDGERQQVHLVKKGKILRGDAVGTYEKVMPPERERELLRKNYKLVLGEAQLVAGRKCWVLEIAPLVAGKAEQKLWIDQETHAVLENKRLLPGRAFVAMIRFTRFDPKADLDDALFALDESSVAPAGKGLEPDFMSLAQLNADTGKNAPIPAELPGGYQFESADFFTVGKSTVRHARYTDGLSVLSIFLTDKPVRLPKGQALPQLGLPRASLRLSSAGKVLHWQRGHLHFTMMGDASRDLLEKIAAALK